LVFRDRSDLRLLSRLSQRDRSDVCVLGGDGRRGRGGGGGGAAFDQSNTQISNDPDGTGRPAQRDPIPVVA